MRLSISLKLALVLVVASVVPLATGVVLAYYDTASMHRSFAGREVRECAADAARAVDSALATRLAQVGLFASDPEVIKYLQERTSAEPPDGAPVDWAALAEDDEPLRTILNNTISEHARSLLRQDEACMSVSVFDPLGRLVAVARRPAAEGWWKCPTPPAGSAPAIRIERLPESGRPVVALCGRIESARGDTLGTLKAMIDSRGIFAPAMGYLERLSSDGPGHAATLDVLYDLEVLASASPDRVGLRLAPGDLPDLPAGTGWGIIEPNGGRRLLISSKRVLLPGGAELSVVVSEEMTEALAGMHRRLSLILILGSCTIIAFFLAGLYVSHRQVAVPIKRLIRGARTLRGGDLSHRIRPRGSAASPGTGSARDELDELADEFNRMAQAIMETQASLGQKVQQRTRQLAEENKKALQAREQLEEALTKLRETQVNLIQTEKLASLGLLVAGVAHEINNPLSFIVNNLSVIQRDYRMVMDLLLRYRRLRREGRFDRHELERIAEAEDELDIDYLHASIDRIFSSTLNGLNRVKTIVHDLKDFSKLEEQEAETLNVEEALDTTLELIGYHLVSGGIDVVRNYCGAPVVRCSPGRLNQVLLNLIMNAVQAMPRGGTITLSTAVRDDKVVVEVADTGCGIAPEHLPKIFDPFFTTKKQGEGTGLGLSVSYGIVREHNGTIEVSSKPGEGSTFTICLPLDGSESTE